MEPSKPSDVYDRDAEWRTLATLWGRRRPQLVFVLGRRRVGKSFVLSRFAREVGGLYYQATKRTEAEQLLQLTRLVGERFDDPALRQGVAFPSWERLLDYLTERTQNRSFLLVLDEFPYLVSATPALPSILQKSWDHPWADGRFKLVLSGSFVTAMRALEGPDQPLYGRRTSRLFFGPFSFADARAFLPEYGIREQLEAYAVFGNLPGNLAILDPKVSLTENIGEALLDPSGPLVDNAQHMLDAFLADARIHYSILEAISLGEQTWSGITKRVGQTGGSLLRPLRWLEDMGLVERIVPMTEKAPQRSKRALYRISDPYVTFWHREIAPLLQAGSIGLVPPHRLWKESSAPRLSSHVGPVFEEVCRQFVRHTERLPIHPMRVGEWWDPHSQNQVDIVAVDAHGDLLVGECKCGAVTREDLSALRTRAGLIAAELGGAPRVHLALFSAWGQADKSVRAAVNAGQALWFTAADVAHP